MIEALNGYAVSQRLREDGQFVLLRARRLQDGAAVLLLGACDGRRDSRERIEREFALRAELDPAFAVMPLALADSHSGHVLVLADSGAAPLVPVPGVAMGARAFLTVALGMAGALDQLHRRGLVHKDLRPEHILLEPGGRVLLTGFGSAARLGAVPRSPDGYQSGSLTYMAPEQTGRVNHAVDSRTDLYALGVVLYQLLCGQLPFAATDAMQWIYCHVARPPTPCATGIDPCCAAIVMKLLAKAPERRYQSAAGLEADLAYCLSLLQEGVPLPQLALGRSDEAHRPHACQALVGRSVQLALLEQALGRAGAGAPDPVLIAGPAGCGKSALIGAFGARARALGARVMHIKFEQHLQETPFAALRAGFALPPAARARMGHDAGLLAHVLPELGRCARAGRGEIDARARLGDAFRRLVALCSSAQAPLVLCFDDLQWADADTLALMSALPGMPHVLLVGALRGLRRAPALRASGEALRRQGVRAQDMALPPLTRAETGELVAASLNCSRTLCAPLADLVHARSGGNPLFAVQLLTRLAEAGLLRHGGAGSGWQWDSVSVAHCAGAATLAELLATRIRQLPYSALELLKLLACLGQHAGAAALARVAGMSEEEVEESLWPAERLGLLRRAGGHYRFGHDLMREAVAAMLGRRGQPERRLHIGRVLALGARGDAIFAAAWQMNRSRDAMGESEVRSLVRINSAAGKRAREALAFDAARSHYRLAVALTTEAAWRSQPERSFALHLALAECEQQCGDLEGALASLAQLDALAAGPDGARGMRAAVALRRVAACHGLGRSEEALQLALDALAWYGLHFPQDAGTLDAALAVQRAAIARASRRPMQTGDEDAIITALYAEVTAAYAARVAAGAQRGSGPDGESGHGKPDVSMMQINS